MGTLAFLSFILFTIYLIYRDVNKIVYDYNNEYWNEIINNEKDNKKMIMLTSIIVIVLGIYGHYLIYKDLMLYIDDMAEIILAVLLFILLIITYMVILKKLSITKKSAGKEKIKLIFIMIIAIGCLGYKPFEVIFIFFIIAVLIRFCFLNKFKHSIKDNKAKIIEVQDELKKLCELIIHDSKKLNK